MTTRNAAGRFAVRWPSVMRTLSALCLLVCATSCARDVEYLRGSEKVIHLKKAEPAPHDGWLLSDDHLAELHELLELKLGDEAGTDRQHP